MTEQPAYERLRHGVDQTLALLQRASFRTLAGWHESALSALWGPAVQTIRHSQATFYLIDGDFTREAMVNARAALEHAITVQWVLHREGGLEQFMDHLIRNHKGEAERFGDWLDVDEIRASADEIDRPGGTFPNFLRNIVGEFDERSFVVNAYGNLSLAAHVRAATTMAYLEGTPGQTHDLFFEPRVTHEGEAPLVAAASAMLSAAAPLTLMGDDDLLDELSDLADALQLPVSLRDELQEPIRRTNPPLSRD